MTITNIEIIKTENNARQLADVRIFIDDCLLIQNVKLIDNGERMFIAFSYQKKEKICSVIQENIVFMGVYNDIKRFKII